MQHYFGHIEGGYACIDDGDAHHLLNVRRGEIGEKLEIAEGEELFLAEIESIDPLRIRILEKIEKKRELDNPLLLAFALLKSDHNELIALKGTELGVSTFIPFTSNRTIVKPKEKEDNKLLRLRKIASEAANQCRRTSIPEVTSYSSFQELMSLKADRKLFAYEGEAGSSASLLSSMANLQKGESILVLIGPEGGFSEKEAKMAQENGFAFVSLGRRILRAETAALYCASIIGAISEEGEE